MSQENQQSIFYAITTLLAAKIGEKFLFLSERDRDYCEKPLLNLLIET